MTVTHIDMTRRARKATTENENDRLFKASLYMSRNLLQTPCTCGSALGSTAVFRLKIRCGKVKKLVRESCVKEVWGTLYFVTACKINFFNLTY